MIWEMKIIFSNNLLLFPREKLSQRYFTSFRDQLVGGALHLSFYWMLAFVG